ncbi:hypothetical protein GEMRC1_006217 [Eukaryota sp. GEM-RC1]
MTNFSAGSPRRASNNDSKKRFKQTCFPGFNDVRSPTGKRNISRRRKCVSSVPKNQPRITQFFGKAQTEDKAMVSDENIATRAQMIYDDQVEAVRAARFALSLQLPSHPPSFKGLHQLGPPDMLDLDYGCLEKLTVFMDLDETLVHTETMDELSCYTHNLKHHGISLPHAGSILNMRILFRPGVEEFLQKVSERFHLVLFTASLPSYADMVLKILDPDQRFFETRLYRQHCTQTPDGRYVKDLRILNRDLRRVVLVDNSLEACGYALDNSVLINTWHDDPCDGSLEQVYIRLMELEHSYDVRREISFRERMVRLLAEKGVML